jgi:hypothetical protein
MSTTSYPYFSSALQICIRRYQPILDCSRSGSLRMVLGVPLQGPQISVANARDESAISFSRGLLPQIQ